MIEGAAYAATMPRWEIALLILGALCVIEAGAWLLNETCIWLCLRRRPRPVLFDWATDLETRVELMSDAEIERAFNRLLAEVRPTRAERRERQATRDLYPNVVSLRSVTGDGNESGRRFGPAA